jgi:hydrogenase maturation protease
VRGAPRRIVCVGNPFVPGDTLGPAVHAELSARTLPDGVAVLDGGVGGLRLLALVDGAERLVFVDALREFAPPGQVAEVRDLRAVDQATGFGHGEGLASLLGLMPAVWDGPPPRWVVVGAEGDADRDLVLRVAERALSLALAPEVGE